MARRESTKEAIIEVAIEIFIRNGYRKSSIDDISRAVGLSRQGIYSHFANKDELFKVTVDRYVAKEWHHFTEMLSRNNFSVEENLFDAFTSTCGDSQNLENLDELLATAATVSSALRDLHSHKVRVLAAFLDNTHVMRRWGTNKFTARQLANHLITVAEGLQHSTKDIKTYSYHIRIAVQMICSGVYSPLEEVGSR